VLFELLFSISFDILSFFFISYPCLLEFVIEHLDKNDLFLLQNDGIDLAPSVNFVEVVTTHQAINRKSIAKSRAYCMIIYLFLIVFSRLDLII